jgi:oxygen-independent coproporphyrinogen-3 oxidase
MTRHLYVHIPFCLSRCAYCDFVSEPVGPHTRAGRVAEYVAAVRRESDERTAAGRPGAAPDDAAPDDAALFETIYLGGGTPTSLPSTLLLELVDDLAARLDKGGEFTVEANPGTLDAVLLEGLAASGVTRLSLGVQSFTPAGRKALGRRVAQSEIAAVLGAIGSTGWSEWNLDLVFGIPGQTWRDARSDLEAAVVAGPAHISLYDLTYTSKYEGWVDAKLGAGARRAAGALAERHYAEAAGRLEAAGYRRYEVSNFCLPGHECRHNLAYWRGEDYLGIGAAAVSTLGAVRRTNPAGVSDYLDGRPPHLEPLTAGTRLWEKAMLGLRTREGVDEEEVLPVLDRGALDRLLDRGCLQRGHGRLRVHPGYLDVSNSVIGMLLVSPGGSDSLQAGGR